MEQSTHSCDRPRRCWPCSRNHNSRVGRRSELAQDDDVHDHGHGEPRPKGTRRWGPVLAQLEADLGVQVLSVITDYRSIVGVWKSPTTAELGHLMPKGDVEATADKADVVPVTYLPPPPLYIFTIVHGFGRLLSGGRERGRRSPSTIPGSTLQLTGAGGVLHERDGHRPDRHFAKVTFTGSHEEASIHAVATEHIEHLHEPGRSPEKDKAQGPGAAGDAAGDLGVAADSQRSPVVLSRASGRPSSARSSPCAPASPKTKGAGRHGRRLRPGRRRQVRGPEAN